MPMKNPPHPGDLIRTEVIEAHGLSVSKAAEILQVRRASSVTTIRGMRLIGLALVLACNGWAQTDPRLVALHETLRSLRAQADVSALGPGGGPKLTLAKHQLRDWI